MKFLPNFVKNSSLVASTGYTILEIIIAVFIVILLFSVTQASYRQFVLNKSLDTVKSQIMSDMKLAQSYASSGKKPATCVSLNGYLFTVYSNLDPNLNYYRISADCITDEIIKEVYLSSLAKNIRFSANVSVLFKILGQGTNISSGGIRTFTIIQSATNSTRTIIVSSAGEVR